MSKTVSITSVLPADRQKIFTLLQKVETLKFIVKPYATFENAGDSNALVWSVGEKFAYKFRLFGFINLGVYSIEVIEFNDKSVYTKEGNSFCPVWNHRIILSDTDNNTQYTDEVEMDAGSKTIFVYLWAKAFYRHRQKKWLKLLGTR